MRVALRSFALCLAVLLTVLLGSAGMAQVISEADADRWDSVAERAEQAVDEGTSSSETFETLRNRIAGFRAEFDAARKANADRIASLRNQLAALGEPPAEGAEPEPADVAAKRTELEETLAAFLAPVQVADAAYRRADGLVGEIDSILRDRQTEKLLAADPSPLNPVYWGTAWSDLRSAFAALWVDRTSLDNEAKRQELRDNLLLVICLGALGLVLVFRGRRWATMLVGRLRRHGARGLGIWRFLVSLLRIFLPLIGLVSLSYAVILTGYLGLRGTELMQLIPVLGAMILGFRWVSERVFSRDDDEALILLSGEARAEARFWVNAITLLIICSTLLLEVLDLHDAERTSSDVVAFPFTALIAFALYRLGLLLRGFSEETDGEAEAEISRSGNFARVVRGFGTASVVVAVVSPLLMAAGFVNASDQLQQPFVITLVLMGLVLALQRFSADVYGAVTGQGAQAREALMPVLFGLVLVLLAAPVLALIWGARVADLSEMWAAFSQGFAIGDTRISPTDFLTFLIIFAIGYVITRLLQGALRTNVLPKTRLDIGGQNAIVSGLGYVGIFLAALIAITGAGIDLSSLAIVAGALSVGIGFGLQNIVQNFVSGIILLIERPISEGDWIEVGGQMGYVRDISVRSTRIETFDRTDVIVPNGDLVSGTVTNYTRGNTVGRVIVKVGVAYGTDTKRVEKILAEIANDQPMVLSTPPPAILFVNFGADALEFEIRMFLRDVNWMMVVKSDVNHIIARRFAEEGIEIPFAQRDVWLRNPEVLRPEAET